MPWLVFSRTYAPPFSETQELAGKGRLQTTGKCIALLVRNPTPTPYSLWPTRCAAYLLGDEPGRIYVLLLRRTWIMKACHSTFFLPSGAARTLRMLEQFYCWIGTSFWCPLVAAPLHEVPSANETAFDAPLALHLDSSASGAGNRGQRGLLRATAGHAPT